MGKPSSSCLKIISCGSDSPVEDDHSQSLEGKESGEKRGWSFRKRSARHRVLSNSVTTESVALGNKDVPQSASIAIQTPVDSVVPEKVAALEQLDEKRQPPASVELNITKFDEPELAETFGVAKPPKSVQLGISETLRALKPQEAVETEVSKALHESPAVAELDTYEFASEVDPIIDAPTFEPPLPTEANTSDGVVAPESVKSIEPLFSEMGTEVSSEDDLLEEPFIEDIHDDVRKLSDERELVKQGSIVKLQAALRGHLVRRQAVDSLYCIQGIIKVQCLVRARQSKLSGDQTLVNKPTTSYSSVEKLLRNAFARQLLKSTPKSKTTVIKCDPLKPTPTWLWLERWMALYFYTLANLEKVETRTEDGKYQVGRVASTVEPENLSLDGFESVDPEYAIKEDSTPLENGKSSFSFDSAEEFQTSNLLSNKKKLKQAYGTSDANFGGPFGLAKQKNQSKRSHAHSQSGPLSNDLALEAEDIKLSTKSMASKQVEADTKKFAQGSRKRSNPFFAAAQSKFEELSSAANYSGSLGSTHQVSSAEYNFDTASCREESVKDKEPSIPDEVRFNVAGSEHGTELSVTSALDSPYLSEVEATELDSEARHPEERSSNLVSNESKTADIFSSTIVQKEFHESSKSTDAADSHQRKQKPEPIASEEQANVESLQMEHKPERTTSDMQADAVSLTGQLAYKPSPGASPNNSYRSPSSQVSGKGKRSKADKIGSNTKHSSLSAGKKTPAKLHDDSGVRNSVEPSSEKRRNSFGSIKSENIDQEPRDSTSSTKTLPSYMQATKSARAKANSPRSSPDVQDKDTFLIKKRHSLPGAGGRQVSPRVQRPASQSPQSQPSKENGTTPPQERRWVR